MEGFSVDNPIKNVKSVLFFNLWASQQNSLRHGHKLRFREIQEVLQKTQHMIYNAIIIQLPKQCTGRSMHQIGKVKNKKCYETNADINMSLMQMRSMPKRPRLQSLDTVLFNRLTTGLMPIISRQPIMHNNDENNHAVLVNMHPWSCKETMTHVNISFLPTRSTVVMQCEDGGHWMHENIVRHGFEVHNGRYYKIQVTQTGHIITRTKWHVTATAISAGLPQEWVNDAQWATNGWQAESNQQITRSCQNEDTYIAETRGKDTKKIKTIYP